MKQRNKVAGACLSAALLAACGGSRFSSSTPLSLAPQIESPEIQSYPGLAAKRADARHAYAVLHSFKGGKTDGTAPEAGLINVKGTLYGTTAAGGSSDNGTVFDLSSSGKERLLYSFSPFGSSGNDGEDPSAGLIEMNGTLYGTTYAGGRRCGCGTVFGVNAAGSERVVYRFKNYPDGSGPTAGLINVKGALYGTTQYGGTHRQGTVFAITASGVETVLHSFAGGSRDGATPWAGLANVSGTLYGTTEVGGDASCGDGFGCGTVFSISTTGRERVLHAFTGGSSDGASPLAGLVNVKGTLYGTTSSGGANGDGTVFSITPGGTETLLYSFKSGADGASPQASLINVNGTLYGTTYFGGSGSCSDVGCGTVFSITSTGKETVLHSFKGGKTDGVNASAALIDVKGMLYGTTSGGGENSDGTVFALTP